MDTSGETILCDLDGTIYSAGATVDGAAEAISGLRELGCVIRFLTNTDSRPEALILSDLHARGVDVRATELFTPVTAARRCLAAFGSEANVLPVVSGALRETFAPFMREGDHPITHVIVGDARDTLSYPVLDGAFRAIRAGAELVALQRGRYSRRADGDHLDTGAIVAALEYASGSTAVLLGKPSQDFLRLAAESAGAQPNEVWVVGDDATTDIAMGNAAGATTVQVRTGKYPDQAAERATIRAAYAIDTIASLPGRGGVRARGRVAGLPVVRWAARSRRPVLTNSTEILRANDVLGHFWPRGSKISVEFVRGGAG
ncbi:TIGR01458 family HAD-type hydrolase [Cryobacterium sp. TMT1-21]|uniref:HAD-IIA family hydrolase n=1 Tax=unclassified Cryobacterium TaxID=2649013 RepID=UPI001068DBD8|nr:MULTISPECIES: HAD hydrolase-like protein [unclassified Cryobacterium]TFC80622.1 TIGR01458 family HAD-type hydrolase [Cryobacterium sp. TmT2-59]TFD14006.1 TIGR01458 family HAD-type hydrolase [Cryobacterium sp. TMT1-21]TFD20721.1 TIGR01458 family HAD-type hydrolase [Cryobacterium sp. TMT4-10]TFD27405.1 TIGR01458 family HAD-type hydrolase [Cryobacterium sp. TMT2-23]TFD39157.1 TIGR01458 family HAD-type hydrolase [Cryobacterium sp. TMT2-10]